MKISRIAFAFVLGFIFTAISSTVAPNIVLAACHDSTGKPVPCPQSRKTPTPIPTRPAPAATECRLADGAPCTPTPVNTTTSGACPLAPCTPTPASTAATTAIPPSAGGGGNTGNSSGDLPAVQNPDPGSSSSGTPGWLIGLLVPAVLIALVAGALIIVVRLWLSGRFINWGDRGGMADGSIGNPDLHDGSDRMGAQPHMNEASAADQFIKGEDQFIKFDGFGGGGEQL